MTVSAYPGACRTLATLMLMGIGVSFGCGEQRTHHVEECK